MNIYEIMGNFPYYPNNIISERFDDSKWLINQITEFVNINLPTINDWDPDDFYFKLFNSVFLNPEFSHVYKEFEECVPYVYVDVKNVANNIHSAKTSVKPQGNNKVKLEIAFEVSSLYPTNKSSLITQADSIIGHEITHIIQRLHLLIGKYDWSTVSGLTPEEIANDLSYIDVRVSKHNMAHYFLKKGEFDAHAYTIGVQLIHQFGNNAIEALKYIMPLVWNGSSNIWYDNKLVNESTLQLLQSYVQSLQHAESNKLLRGNHSAASLWKKFTKEISKYISGR